MQPNPILSYAKMIDETETGTQMLDIPKHFAVIGAFVEACGMRLLRVVRMSNFMASGKCCG